MVRAHLEHHRDFVVVPLEGMLAVAALQGTVILPHSTIESMEVKAAKWPPVVPVWRVGIHMPGIAAIGSFRHDGKRSFLVLGKGDESVLHIRLGDHPDFDEVQIACEQPELERRELERRLRPP